MVFAYPHLLWLLILAVGMGALYARHRVPLSRGVVVGSAVLRCAGAILLVFAIAQPVLLLSQSRTVAVAVVDVSPSMTDADFAEMAAHLQAWQQGEARHADARYAVVAAGEPYTLNRGEIGSDVAWLRSLRGEQQLDASRLASALELAATCVGEGDAGRITLFSDGLGTSGDLAAAAVRLGRIAIELHVMPCGAARTNELVLVAATLPSQTRRGETAPLSLRLDSSREGEAELAVLPREGSERLLRETLSLRRGTNEFTFPLPLNEVGMHALRVRCTARWDTVQTNNECLVATHVATANRITVVESAVTTPCALALADLLVPSGEIVTAAAVQLNEELNILEDTNLLVVSDTPASDLSILAQERICDAVRRGMGLLYVGGRRSFGPGGYAGSQLADILPLDFSQQTEKRDPSVTLVVIIDTSGSMKGPRIDLAKEVARLAIQRLQAHDKVGIVEFYGTKRWAARIQSAGNRIDINRALNRLSAGGGTIILPALEEAYYALLNVRTRTKHVLIITDGGVETGPFQKIITRMADAGITVSTVVAGPGQYSGFLTNLAQWGRGRSYASPDRFNLPEILLKQPENVPASPYVEQPETIRGDLEDRLLEGIPLDTVPPVDGYVRTRARPTASVLLSTESGDPLLARWRYGRGYVAAYASDIGGPWSADLWAWPSAGRLLSNLARQIAAPASDDALDIKLIARPAGVEVQISHVGYETPAPLQSLTVKANPSSGDAIEHIVDPMGTGQWNHLLPDFEEGVLSVNVHSESGHLTGHAAIGINAIPEISATQPATKLLRELEALADVEQTNKLRQQGRVYVELWPWCAILALVFQLLNVLVRRWPYRSHAVTRTVIGLIVLIAAAPTHAQQVQRGSDGETTRAAAHALLGKIGESQSIQDVAGILTKAQVEWQKTGIASDDVFAHLRETDSVDLSLARLEALIAARRGAFDAAEDILTNAYADAQQAIPWWDIAIYRELQDDFDGAAGALAKCRETTVAPERAVALAIRQALLAADTGKTADAKEIFNRLTEEHAGTETLLASAIVMGEASLAGEAVALIGRLQDEELSSQLLALRGLFAARSGTPQDAARQYAQAALMAERSWDRSFAIQMEVESARRAGMLDILADEWLASSEVAVEQLVPLLGVLREVGRIDDVLNLLSRVNVSPSHRSVLESSEFQQEVVTTAMEAGRRVAAENIYRARIADDPERLEWRTALARLYVQTRRRAEAEQLFRDGLDFLRDADDRYRLAAAAQVIALDSIAQEIVSSTVDDTGASALRAALWLADLYDRRGRAQASLDEIVRAERIAGDDLGMTKLVADAYERLDQPARAAALLEDIGIRTNDVGVWQRLAWLLDNLHRYSEAQGIWRRLWEEGASEALRKRAAERLLDLASKTNTLADLAIDLEQKLLNHTAATHEVSLLVELYTRLGDAVSVSEILFLSSAQSENEIDATRQLARACIAMGRLAQADEALRRLLDIDPSRRFDYLQELTVLAAERNRPDVAYWSIGEMAKIMGGGAIVEELSAGVYEMLGDHERAVDAYTATLERHPERIEVWLLWSNAMQESGRADEAISRLQMLVEEAVEDDLFLVAVDGLLNLEASPRVLRVVLRRLRERSARSPRKIYLYDVTADVLEALGQAEQINTMMERALVFAGAGRGALLREMIERAKAEGDDDRVISYGNLLVAMRFQVPPQVYIDLGRTLLANNKPVEADRAFGRGRALGERDTVGLQVADAFEDALLPEKALSVVNELLIFDPTDVMLLHRAAALHEQVGDHAEALELYTRALDILAGRIPESSTAITDTPLSRLSIKRRRRIAANIDELSLLFDPTVDGMIVASRSHSDRAMVVELLATRAVDALDATRSSPMSTIGHFPRLVRLSAAARFAAFALHQPDVADNLDTALLARFPEDAKLCKSALDERIQWGVPERALAIASDRLPRKSWPYELRARELLSDRLRLTGALEQNPLDGRLAEYLLPQLVMEGRDEDARRLLDAPWSQWRQPSPNSARAMLIGCVALDHHDALATWALRYLESCKAKPDGKTFEHVSTAARLTWHSLDRSQRIAFLEKAAALAAGARAVEIEQLCIALAEDIGSPNVEYRQKMKALARKAGEHHDVLVGLLHTASTSEERAGLLETAWSQCQPDNQYRLLMEVAGQYAGPGSDSLVRTFSRLLEISQLPRLNRHTPYASLTRSDWPGNHRQPEPGLLIAQALLKTHPENPAVLVAAATAYRSAQNRGNSEQLSRTALEHILADREIDAEGLQMLTEIARLLPRADRDAFVANARAQMESDDGSALELLSASMFLAECDRDVEGFEMMAAAFHRDPTDQLVRRALLEYAEIHGFTNELPRLLAPHLSNSAVMQSYDITQLAEAYRLRYQPEDALRVLGHGASVMSTIQVLRLEDMLGQTERFRLILRRYLAKNRREQRFYVPRVLPPPLPGGMEEYLHRQGPTFSRRTNLFAAIADNSDVTAEVDALWQSAAPERTDVPGLARARIEAARSSGTLKVLARELEDRIAKNSLQSRDMFLLAMLLADADVQLDVPDDWKLPLLPSAQAAQHVAVLEAWAQMLIQAGHSTEAGCVLRWLVAIDSATPRRDTDTEARMRRIDLYLATLPPDSRNVQRSRLLTQAIITPVEPLADRFDAALYRRTIETGDSSVLTKARMILERCLARMPANTYAPRMHRVLAYDAALNNDVEQFVERVDALFAITPSAFGGFFPPDPLAFLPDADRLADPATLVSAIESATHRAVELGYVRRGEAVKTLVLIGRWCVDQGREPLCKDILDRTRGFGGTSSATSRLWIADLARSLDVQLAVDEELLALEAGVLPMARIGRLLDDVERLNGRTSADRLALTIRTQTDHEEVARRAARAGGESEHRE